MGVNALVTSLIVFKILEVFLEVKATLVERTFGSLSSTVTGGTKLQHIIFVIIESGMALFAIQLVRVMLTILTNGPVALEAESTSVNIAWKFVIVIHEMLNVIIRSIHFYSFCFTDDIYLARASHQQLFWCGSQ